MGNDAKKKRNKAVSRRTFLKTIPAAAAAGVFFPSCSPTGEDNGNSEPQVLGPRVKAPNPYVNAAGDPILVCVYGTDFATMLRAGMNSLGGFGRLVLGRNVLVKPALNHGDPFPGVSSAQSIITIVNELYAAASGNVSVGDMGHDGSVYGYLDLDSLVPAAGATLLDFRESYPVRRNSWDDSRPDFTVYREVYDAPVIVSTCSLKRHDMTSFTCALKCNIGCVSGPGVSGTRRYIHLESDILQEIAEVAGVVNPELNIVDARSILIKGGPMIEMGKVVDGVNRVILCGDMVATDVYCARIMEQYDDGFSISGVQNTLSHAESLGLGTADLNRVEIREIYT